MTTAVRHGSRTTTAYKNAVPCLLCSVTPRSSPSLCLSRGKGDFWLAPFQPCHAEKQSLVLHPPARSDTLLSWAVFFPIDWRCITEFSLFSKSNPTNYSCRVKTGGLLKFLVPLSCWQIGYWFSSVEITSQGQPNYFYSLKSRKQKVPVNLIGSFQVLQRFC